LAVSFLFFLFLFFPFRPYDLLLVFWVLAARWWWILVMSKRNGADVGLPVSQFAFLDYGK